MADIGTYLKRLRQIKRVAVWAAIGAFFIPSGYMALLMTRTLRSLVETDVAVPGERIPVEVTNGVASFWQMNTYTVPILLLGITVYLIASSLERKALYKAMDGQER